MQFNKLKEPFAESDIEWRVAQAGKRGEKVWAKVLAYVTNRAIMDRLDAVCGPENWKNRYDKGPGGGVICGISIKIDGEWIEKWDGADNTQFEATKGGLSGAMKRAAVQWGVGRYLYDLKENWAVISDNGSHYQPGKQGSYPAFKWDPPKLPDWALPTTTKSPVKAPKEAADAPKPQNEGVDTGKLTKGQIMTALRAEMATHNKAMMTNRFYNFLEGKIDGPITQDILNVISVWSKEFLAELETAAALET
jgi:hypothetical protein